MKKNIFLAVILLLVLTSCNPLENLMLKSMSPAHQTAVVAALTPYASPTFSPTRTPLPSITPTPTLAPTVTPTPILHSLAIAVMDISTAKALGVDLKANPGYQFLILEINLHNISPEPVLYNMLKDFWLRDKDGNELNTGLAPQGAIGIGGLQPHKHIQGLIVFQIPNNQTDFTLIYRANPIQIERTLNEPDLEIPILLNPGD